MSQVPGDWADPRLGGPGFGLFSNADNVVVPSAWGERWGTARKEGGSRRVNIHLWGDSIGADGASATNTRTLSMAGLLQAQLQAKYGNGGTGFLNTFYAAKTGTWDAINDMGFAGTGARATAAATLSWTDIRGTTVRIYHRNTGLTGSFRWRIDGGSFTTVTPPTGFGVEPGVVEITGLPDTPHTVDVEWVSGTIVIHGVYAHRNTGIVLNRLGQGGRAASHFSNIILNRITIGTTNASATITSATPGVFTSSMIGRYVVGTNLPKDAQITAVASATSATISAPAMGTGTQTVNLQINRQSWAESPGLTIDPFFSIGLGRPDLWILMLGVNDPAGLDNTATTWSDGASRLVKPYYGGNTYNFSPDGLVIIEHQGDWFDLEGRWPDIARAQAAFASAMGAALIDLWGMGRRSYKYWLDLGYFTGGDGVHPTNAGHAAYADPTLKLLTA